MVQISYNMHPETIENQYHMDLVRSTLTRNIPALLPDLIDEIQHAFPQVFPLQDQGILSTHLQSQQYLTKNKLRMEIILSLRIRSFPYMPRNRPYRRWRIYLSRLPLFPFLIL